MDIAKRLINLTRQLIAIDSQNPPGNERALAFFIQKTFSRSGLATRLVAFAKNRYNTITIFRSKAPKTSLLITPHLDTVPFGKNWRFEPLGASIHNNRIYGRGATDCKSNIAVGMEVMRSLAEENIPLCFDVVFSATADEETGSHLGLIPLLERRILAPGYALILDADDFDIVVAQKGLLHILIGVAGEKAHGAYPQRGINAIELCIALIEKIRRLRFHYKPHPLLNPPTINIGTIKGGDKVNIVPDWCEVELDIRYMPGMNKQHIVKTILRLAHSVCKRQRVTVAITEHQLPCQIDTRHILARSLKEASKQATGSYRFKGSEGATVMTFFAQRGIPTVATGVGSSPCAHTTDEYVAIPNLMQGYHMLKKFLLIFDSHLREGRENK